jgi:hypothetical protein
MSVEGKKNSVEEKGRGKVFPGKRTEKELKKLLATNGLLCL